jgi:hypothetical protein
MQKEEGRETIKKKKNAPTEIGSNMSKRRTNDVVLKKK